MPNYFLGNDKQSGDEGKGLMNGVDDEENSRSFARSLSRLASKGGRAMKRGVSREFDRETMKTNLKLFIAMGLTWIAGMILAHFYAFLFDIVKALFKKQQRKLSLVALGFSVMKFQESTFQEVFLI